MNAKKACSVILCAMLLVSLFVGCGSDETGSGEASTGAAAGNGGSNEPDGGTVTLEVAVSGSAQELAIHQEKFDLYMEQNPDITIKPIDIGSDRVQKTLTLISAGEAPDILYINENLYAYASKEVVLPLTELIERDSFDTSIFQDNLLDPLTYKGDLYALPQEISPFCVYYNIDMFEAAGAPLPTDDWTIDDFYAAALAITDPDAKVYGYYQPTNWPDQIWLWFTRSGANYDVTGSQSVGFDSPEILDTLEILHRMVAVDKVSPNPADLAAMGEAVDVMFVNQTVAMQSAGLWLLPQYKAEELEFDWDVVMMPKGANQGTMAGILNWAISTQSDTVDATWDLLKFLVGEESMKIVASNGMALPGSKDEAANQIVIDTQFPANVEAFVNSVGNVDFRTQKNVYYNEVQEALNTQIELLLLDQQTPEETQQAIIDKFDQILAGD